VLLTLLRSNAQPDIAHIRHGEHSFRAAAGPRRQETLTRRARRVMLNLFVLLSRAGPIAPSPETGSMRANPLALLTLITGMLLAVTGGQGADEDAPPSFPKAGAFLPGPFHVINLNGQHKNRYHCLVCQNGTLPVAAVLARMNKENDDASKFLEPEQPLTKLLLGIERVLAKNPDGNMAGYAVFFGDKADIEVVQARLDGRDNPPVKALTKEAQLKYLTFGYDDKGSASKYFADVTGDDKGNAMPEEDIVRVLFYNKYRMVHEARDFTKDKPLTDKDVTQLLDEWSKMQPPPVVNRKKFKPDA